MIVGVGGQGTLLASKLLGRLLVDEGYDVKVSEVHGMSQRGGSVVTYVRFGDKVRYSPIMDNGEADLIVSFEKLEAARWLAISEKGRRIIVVNTQQIDPMPVIMGCCGVSRRRAGGDDRSRRCMSTPSTPCIWRRRPAPPRRSTSC